MAPSKVLSTWSFDYTGSSQSFVVPLWVTSIDVVLYGASGGDSQAAGGKGGKLSTTLSVTPGETLRVYVGGVGSGSSGSPTGGWNGGGSTGWAGAHYGPGGGGATDIRRGGSGLENRILVAGGGGGAGESDAGGKVGGVGGAGGGTSGDSGGYGVNANASPGGGGTQGAGGTAGTGNRSGTAGSLGQGGAGSPGQDGFDGACGGGGGGGYYGGGGGGGHVSGGGGASDNGKCGGGGGSGYDSTGIGVFEIGVQSGNGYVTITWSAMDSGLRYSKGGVTYGIGCTPLQTNDKVRVNKNGTIYGVPLLDPSATVASPIRVFDGSSVKALPKYTL